MSKKLEIRTYAFLDNLQPQVGAFFGTVSTASPPMAGNASLFVEIAPGIEINRLTDIAVKSNDVKPGMQIIERVFGLLEIHSPEQAETRGAGEAILAECGVKESDRIKPKVLSNQIIHNVDDHHAQLINRMRHGQMLIPGQTLFVMECEPAAYAPLAANEAEKAADINILEIRAAGAVGRIFIGGYESEIEIAKNAAMAALESIDGREK